MSTDFDNLTEDEQDDVARAKIKQILAKPQLEEGDAATVAACVAFIGTSNKMADKFSQALLDAAESLTQGLCVRCGLKPGTGPSSCLICQGIRSVQTMKLVQDNGPQEEPLEKIEDREVAAEEHGEPIEDIDPDAGPPQEDLQEAVADVDDIEEQPEAQLHKEYPHHFKKGYRLNKSKAISLLAQLEELQGHSLFKDKDQAALEHLRAHLEPEEDKSPDERPATVICPGCSRLVPNTITCIRCGVELHWASTNAEVVEEQPAEEDPEAQLHEQYPHHFTSSGKLSKAKARDLLARLETMTTQTDDDLVAITHLREHLEIEVQTRAPEPIKETVATVWTARQIDALTSNAHLSPDKIQKYVSRLEGKTLQEIQNKLEELKLV